MLRIAVCDDKKTVLDAMREYLADFEKLLLVDTYESGEALLESGAQYDLYFLDIDMKGISGIEAARRLRRTDKKAKIIYVTAYEDFRDYAFSVHAFAYLVKPVKKEEIQAILREALAYTLEEKPESPLRFETLDGIVEIKASDILYLEYLNRRIKIAVCGKELWMKGSITAMAQRLEGYDFFMPHKSFLVNLSRVQNLKGCDIFLTDGSCIPLSQKKAAQFRKRLTEYLAEQL